MIKIKHKAATCLIVLLSFMVLTATAFGQGASSTMTGNVRDASGGAIVGAAITVRNVGTGVETKATTNNAGIYNLVLQPGNYTVTADAPGFQRTTITDVRLNAGIPINLPLAMAVAGSVETVEVTGTAESLVLEASASTGTLIQESVLSAIPTVAPNAIESTLNVMGGVTRMTSGSTVFSASAQEVAGVSSSMINVSRDGITVNEVRNPTGIAASSNINPEVVGEMRVIQSAVDAELGRGAGQIQITTRSGGNDFHGSAVWNIQNTALDATDFSVKQRGLTQNWRNVNNYTLTASGPIIKNKTFFFASWEQQIARDKVTQIPRVMTSCARRGIYRWLTSADANTLQVQHLTMPERVPRVGQGGWLPSVISSTNSYNIAQGNMRSVNDDGTPWSGGEVLNLGSNTPVTVGQTEVMFESVFGELTQAARDALMDPNNPGGVYGDGVTGCTWMDDNGYSPLNGNFLTTGSGNVNTWTNANHANGPVYRYAYDPTGFAHRFVFGAPTNYGGEVRMPDANYFRGLGDGLNTAGHRWTTTMVGMGSSNYGTGGDPDRKSITARVDHNINNDHRLSGTFDWENFYVWDAYSVWPEDNGGYHAEILRKPYRFSATLNSTLAPTVLNELRFGLSRSDTWVYKPLDSADGDKMASVLQALAGNAPDSASNPYAGTWAADQILLIGLGEGDGGANATAYRNDVNPIMGAVDNLDRSHPYGTRGNLQATWGGHDPRWSLGDTVTWLKGTHSFKGGVEYRRQSSYQMYQGTTTSFARGGGNTNLSVARGGATAATVTRRRGSLASANAGGVMWQNIYALSQDTATTTNGNYVLPYNLMTFFSGALSDTSLMYYSIPDGTGARWNDLAAGEDTYDYTVSNQELNFFFKDDWKVTDDLTLNLGVRWEYYGVPHASDGKTLSLVGGSSNAWGITTPGDFYNNGKGWIVDRTYLPGAGRVDNLGNLVLPAETMAYEYIGPGTANPDRMVWNRDMNNFAPHVGFAWQLPWFGRGLTTLRGGYSISYAPVDNFNNFPGQFVNLGAANVTYTNTYTGVGLQNDPTSTAYYMDLTDLKTLLPLRPAGNVLPLGVPKNGDLYTSAAIAIDENITTPYVHSLNASITRSIGSMLTLDLRYVGTFRRNSIANLDVNANNYLDTTLFNWISELDTVRLGNESMVINSLIPHNAIGGQLYYGSGRGRDQAGNSIDIEQTGSAQLREQEAGNLARGVYNTIVNNLRTSNGMLPRPFGSERGLLMRSGCLPGDRPGYAAAFAANPLVDVNNYPCSVGTPANFLFAAPQYTTSNYRHNTNSVNNYNSMQAQVTMRPTHGLNFQATYTWSRNIGSDAWTNYLGERDYILSGQHRTHMLRTFGSYELPFGSRGFFFRDATGVVKKAIEGWNLSWVLGMESGPPLSVTGNGVLNNRTWPVLVRSDLWNDKQGKARTEWNDDGTFRNGTYLETEYVKVIDPNICNSNRMSAGLYGAQCNAQNATYALALGDGNGNAAVYASDYMGDDGRMYAAGSPIIVFRNADQSDGPNAGGNYKPNRMTAQGRFSFDMAASKTIEFMEGKRFEFRVDVQNVLNHATPNGNVNGAPSAVESGGKYVSIDPAVLNIANSAPLGLITTKGGHRTFQARLALRF